MEEMENTENLEFLMEVIEDPRYAKRQLLKIQNQVSLNIEELNSLYEISNKIQITCPQLIEDWMWIFSFFKAAGGDIEDLK